MTVLVVGDRTAIEKPLRRLRFVREIRLLDVQGNAIPSPEAAHQTSNR